VSEQPGCLLVVTRLWRVAAAALLVAGSRLGAQATRLDVSGSPGNLAVTSAPAGFQPAAVIDASTQYSVRVHGGTKKITAELSAPMPAGVSLTVTLSAVSGGTSAGPVTLDTTPRDVVVNLSNGADLSATITYQLTTTTEAGIVAAQSRTVTFSLVNYP